LQKLTVKWDKYHSYQEMSDLLRAMAESYPDLCRIYSIGQTYLGREVWCIEITNQATGKAEDKPGFQIDANTHAGEVTGTEVALYDAWYLLDRYGQDEFVTSLVDSRVIYVIPRIGADAAEHYLTTPYNNAASSMRPYPLTDDEWQRTDGLYHHDVDGDGEILQMRLQDPKGDWKVSRRDPRIMLRRQPEDGEDQGPFYRLHPEGLIRNYDGGPVKMAPPRYGLNFNRNWPANWAVTEDGAGPFPLSEPETRAMADFWRSHPNICGVMTYHTFSGVIIRSYVTRPDEAFPREDLATYKAIGRIGTALTGYDAISVFEDFTPDKSNPRHGNSKDWWYEHLGVHVFCIELWSFARMAGVEVKDYFAFLGARPEEDELKLLRCSDELLGGAGFKPWTACEHPQLGSVEVGGWRYKYVFQNPPPQLLRQEIERTFIFCLKHAALSPLVRLRDVSSRDLGPGTWEVSATIANEGWLPTYITQQALDLEIARPVEVHLELPPGVSLEVGRQVTSVGHLRGMWALGPGRGLLPVEAKVKWVLRGEPGSQLTGLKIVAVSQKGGRSEAALGLSQS